jgi:tRNA/rRNA methyltransferase
MSEVLERVRVVLVRPSHAGNVGAVARAMANLSLRELCLVGPVCDPLSREALQRSTRGEAILRAARVVEEVGDALDGVTYTVAASCRGGRYREQIELTPREMAAIAVERLGGGRTALLFGPEDGGLRSDEVLPCDAVVRIPASEAYPSFNLSHAVTICLYELFVAAKGTAAGRSFHGAGTGEPANAPTMHALMRKLEAALVRIGYVRAEHPEHLLYPIRAILSRAGLSQTEAQILIGLAQQMQEFADGSDRGRS